MSTQQASDTLGGSLIGVINHLQDVFSQVEDLPPSPTSPHLTFQYEPAHRGYSTRAVSPRCTVVQLFQHSRLLCRAAVPGRLSHGLDLRTPFLLISCVLSAVFALTNVQCQTLLRRRLTAPRHSPAASLTGDCAPAAAAVQVPFMPPDKHTATRTVLPMRAGHAGLQAGAAPGGGHRQPVQRQEQRPGGARRP